MKSLEHRGFSQRNQSFKKTAEEICHSFKFCNLASQLQLNQNLAVKIYEKP